MCKRFFVLFLICGLLCSVLPPVSAAEGKETAFAETVDSADLVRNSDSEAAFDGTCWYVDTMGEGCLLAARVDSEIRCRDSRTDPDPVIAPVTEWPVDQVLYWEGRLLVSAGNRLLTLEPVSGAVLDCLEFDAPVDRFARSPAGLYVLTGGEIRLLGAGEQIIVSDGVTRFWLEDPDRLCFMRDESVIHSLSLSTGAVSDAPNRSSELGNVLVPASENKGMGLIGVRQKFPHGKYWNHMPDLGTGMEFNNQDGWTEIPCPKHNGYCGTSKQSCNGYAPEGEELSYQCWGYADKLGHDVSGCDPQKLSEGDSWKKLYYKASLNNLKAGDIIRFNRYGNSKYAHTIYVTAVSGDTITYTDCNFDGSCVIRWDQTISLSTVRSWFVFLLCAPAAATVEPTWPLMVNAVLDGTPAASAEGWAVFDVLLNGEPAATGVSSFHRDLLPGTTYEIRGVAPNAGILFDQAGAGELRGTVGEEPVELTLSLDHYYLNEAGETVKTTLTDLPGQTHWSYRPICWALEQGIAGGVSVTRFAPSEICTRAQIVTFLWAFAGRPEPEGDSLPFLDVKESSYFFRPVLWALEAGITAGRSDTEFAPNAPCSRGEVVTFLWNLAGRPEAESVPEPEQPDGPFADVGPDDFYYFPVLWAVDAGITGGTGPQTFSPQKTCNRAEILTFLRAVSGNLTPESPEAAE
ncbi:MAG: S-layer homology domain-containing protein [Oscillospiraceae bacterium]|nr:S-layer homology domain-containing protein [Oscillospiraceae bacterium]